MEDDLGDDREEDDPEDYQPLGQGVLSYFSTGLYFGICYHIIQQAAI